MTIAVVLEGLGELGLAGLIDERWRTQLSIAEADMVRWLTFPTELGRAATEREQRVDGRGVRALTAI